MDPDSNYRVYWWVVTLLTFMKRNWPVTNRSLNTDTSRTEPGCFRESLWAHFMTGGNRIKFHLLSDFCRENLVNFKFWGIFAIPPPLYSTYRCTSALFLIVGVQEGIALCQYFLPGLHFFFSTFSWGVILNGATLKGHSWRATWDGVDISAGQSDASICAYFFLGRWHFSSKASKDATRSSLLSQQTWFSFW